MLGISYCLLQGLALGGEYGGAATYVAEHSHLPSEEASGLLDHELPVGLFVSRYS